MYYYVDYRMNSTSQCPHYTHGLNPHLRATCVPSIIFLHIFRIFFDYVLYLPQKLMRKIILKFNLYIHIINVDQVFTRWLINALALKIYKKDPIFQKWDTSSTKFKIGNCFRSIQCISTSRFSFKQILSDGV